MTTTTDRQMERRFTGIPWRGAEPDEPLVGWRLEGVERGRLFNIDPTGGLRVPRCSHAPEGWLPSLQIFGTHAAPHPDCQCGVRLVCRLEDLSAYWAKDDKVAAASGLGLPHITGDADGRVLVRMRSEGYVCRGWRMPDDDPRMTARVSGGQLLEVFHPAWVDPAPIVRTYPGVPVRPISDLPGEDLPTLRLQEPPEPTLKYQSLKHHLRIVMPVADVKVPRTYLQPAAVREAIWGALEPGWGKSHHLRTIIDRLVTPLTDLTDHEERVGCAHGLVVGIASLADAHQKAGKF